MKITPTQSVISGWNGTIKGVEALAASLERNQVQRLFKEYSLFHESHEDFETRMKEAHGENWVNILNRI